MPACEAAWAADAHSDCPCGSRLPRLARIEGRDDDYLEYPDGRRVHPARITVAVKSPCFAHPGAQIFRDYRITQDGPAHVTIRIENPEVVEAYLGHGAAKVLRA